MQNRIGFTALSAGLVLLAVQAIAGAGQVDRAKESLPPGAIGQLGSMRLRGRDLINCVTFSPDGKYAAAGGGGQFTDFSIYLWDCATGKLVRRFVGHYDRYWDLAFTPDGSVLISGGADGIRYWDVKNGTMLRWTRTTGLVSALAISHDGKIVAAGTSQGAIHLWKENGKELIGSIPSPSSVEYLAFSPDDRWLVSTGWDLDSKNTVRFWDVSTRKKVWELPGHDLENFWRNSVAFSADGNLFAMATERGEIQIWNIRERKQVRAFPGPANGKRACVLGFAKKDSLLFSLSHEGAVRIWDLENAKLREEVKEKFGWNVALSPDAGTIAYGDARTVKLWDINAKQQRLPPVGHYLTVRSLDFSPDGKTLASCADDDTVRLWNVKQRAEVRQWAAPGNPAWQVRFSKDGKSVATANWEYVELRDVGTGKLVASLRDNKHWALTAARILPDQKTVVSVEDKRICVWNVEQKRVIRTFPTPIEEIESLTISPDGQLVALSGSKGIALLDTTTGKVDVVTKQGPLFHAESPAFSPDRTYLAWPAFNAVVVWDIKQMKMHRRMKTRDDVTALAFDRTGRYLATAGNGPRIRIWDLRDGSPAGDFTNVGGAIGCLAFSPTEDILASAGDDGTITLWDLHKKTAPPPPPATDEMLRKLLAAYRLYGLPTPPGHVKLVRFDLGKDGQSLELLVQPAKGKDKRATFWNLKKWRNFTSYLGDAEPKYQMIEPTPAALRGDPDLWDDGLTAAIHCNALGWDALAKAVFESNNGIIPETAAADLAILAWFHWKGKINETDENWREIAKYLRILVNDRPNDFETYEKEFVRSLELALLPSKAKPGSLEAMVDNLIEVRANHLDGDSPYRKLALHGFEAVPTLIAHLDDERLTKRYRAPFNNFRGYQYRICDMATDILQALAGSDLGAWRLRGDILGKAGAQAWWDEAKKVGEETYLLRHVLGEKKSDWPNTLMLDIITQKYATNLPQVYRQMLADRPKMHGSRILDAISLSSLPASQKRTLFLLGAKDENPARRSEALEHLKKLDSK